MRDAVAIASPVAWLAVWNRNIVIDSRTSRREEEEQDDPHDENDNENQDRNRSGVLYGRTYRSDASGSKDDERDLLTRRIGLAQGLIDFTRSFARKKPLRRRTSDSLTGEDDAEQEIVDPTKEIKVVNSQNQRLVFIEPEEHYWIVGAFDRYNNTPSSKAHVGGDNAGASTTALSSKGKQKKTPGQPQNRLQPSSFLPNEALTDLLMRAYAEFRLFHGTFGYILESEGVDNLRASLETFFDCWRHEAKLIPLGLPKAVLQHSQIDFPPSLANTSIVAISQSGLLEIPFITDDNLTPSDRLALAYYLASILPKPTPPPLSVASISKEKNRRVKKQPSMTASAWKSLNLGGISNYLPSMPSMPGTSSSSSAAPKAGSSKGVPASRPSDPMAHPSASTPGTSDAVQPGTPVMPKNAQAGKRSTSGSTWMPSFSIFGGAAKIKDNAPEDKLPSEPLDGLPDAANAPIQAPAVEVRPDTTEMEVSIEPPDTAPSEASLEALSEAMVESISPGLLSPIADAPIDMGPTALLKTGAEAVTLEASIQENESEIGSTWQPARNIFVGQNRMRRRCHCVYNKEIAVAFIETKSASSELDKESTAGFDQPAAEAYLRHLTKACTPGSLNQLSGLHKARTFLTFATSDCNTIQEQIIDDRASASTASLGQRFNLAISGKTDTDKLMRPGVSEVFVRNFCSQWLVARRNDAEDTQTRVTILPKSVGKEGSLVDADAEIRRIAHE